MQDRELADLGMQPVGRHSQATSVMVLLLLPVLVPVPVLVTASAGAGAGLRVLANLKVWFSTENGPHTLPDYYSAHTVGPHCIFR